MKSVVTDVAGEFICDACGRNSYFSWVSVSLKDLFDPENEYDMELAEELGGGEISEKDVLLTEPDRVTCAHCQEVYEICNDQSTPHNHSLKTTETFQAAEFMCRSCGELNFFSLTAPEEDMLTEEEIEALQEKAGLDGPPGQVFIFPETVSCKKCGKIFKPKEDKS